jgi:uncharacterized membrane protein YccC
MSNSIDTLYTPEQIALLKAQANERETLSSSTSNWAEQVPSISTRNRLVSKPNVRAGNAREADPSTPAQVIPNEGSIRPSQEVAARLGRVAQEEAKAALKALEQEEQQRQILDISNIEKRVAYLERKLKQLEKKGAVAQ